MLMNIRHYESPRYMIGEGKQGAIIGQTPQMHQLFAYLNLLAQRPTTVLLYGETGTGKELCARALHYNGLRSGHPFLAVNCAGIPETLLETELFGHEKGSFTGADRRKIGKFEMVNNGTLFLDEIGEMSLDLQAKMLRVLQEQQFERVGGNETLQVDVRVVAGTNINLEEAIEKKTFRKDLYYRLNVVQVSLPSLGQRVEDISFITHYHIQQRNEKYGAAITGITPGAMQALENHSWKGNIRELENVLERVFMWKGEGMVEENDLQFNAELPSVPLERLIQADDKRSANNTSRYF